MPRTPKPWYRKDRDSWFVTIAGTRHNLGPEKEAAHRLYHEILAQEPAEVSSGSIAYILDKFLTHCKEEKKAATYDWHEGYLQDFLDYLKSKRINAATFPPTKLKVKTIRDWVNDRGTAKMGRITSVKAAFSWADQEDEIPFNPIAGMKRPAANKRKQTIPLADFKKILRLSKDKQFRDLLIVSWDIGARPQEVKRLEIRHLELENRRCVLDVEESKGESFSRVIYLTARAERIIRRNIKSNKEFVFLNTQGKVWTSNAVRSRFRRLQDKIGVRYSQYAFRHTFATRMLKQGKSAIAVAELLGHSDPSTLAKTYQHVAQDPEYMLSVLDS